MLISHRWQSRTALLIALGITATAAFPLLSATTAIANSKPYVVGQLFPRSREVRVSAGTVIPVRFDEAERIVVTPDETAPITLVVAEDIRSAAGTVLIPAGSKIEGNLQPVRGGTQFVAEELTFRNSNRQRPIDATSEIITETETIEKGSNSSSILKGAAIGAAAAAALSEIFGDIDVIEVLAGGGVGAVAGLLLGGRNEAQVVVINPDTDLDLTLQSDFVLN